MAFVKPRALLTIVMAMPLMMIDLVPDFISVLIMFLLVLGLRFQESPSKSGKTDLRAQQSAEGSSANMKSKQVQWWPNLLKTDGQWSDEVKVLRSTMPLSAPSTHRFDGDADNLLGQLQEIIIACRTPAGRVGDMVITPCAQHSSHSVAIAQKGSCPVGIICSEVVLKTELPIDAISWALYNVDERLSWDRAAFRKFEVLGPSAPQGLSSALGDVIYCRIPLPTPMQDRDMVQERFLMRLPECSATPAGGFAIVMRSPSEATARMLGRPPIQDAVRATSIISGFLLQPHPGTGGVLFTAVSCTDIGGCVPRWAQVLAQKTCVRMSLDMANRLQDHCNNRRPEN